MKRRIPVLFLALALALSVPSSARAPTQLTWTQWMMDYTSAHPDEVAAFDADAWFREEHGCCFDSVEEYMDFSDFRIRADFEESMLEEWLSSLYREYTERMEGERYARRHPEEARAFDPDAWYENHYSYYYDSDGYPDTPAAFMEQRGLDQTAFLRQMIGNYVNYHRQLDERLVEQQSMIDGYFLRHPEKEALFDLDSYFTQLMGPGASQEEYRLRGGLTPEQLRANFLYMWVLDQQVADEEERVIAAYAAEYPDRVAAFDAEAWLSPGGYGYHGTKEEFIALWRINQEEFERKMLRDYVENHETDWYDGYNTAWWQAHALKRDLGGEAVEVNVTIDGEPLVLRYCFKPFAIAGTVYLPVEDLTRDLGVPIEPWSHGYARQRTAAWTVGYSVTWDSATQTAALLSPAPSDPASQTTDKD